MLVEGQTQADDHMARLTSNYKYTKHKHRPTSYRQTEKQDSILNRNIIKQTYINRKTYIAKDATEITDTDKQIETFILCQQLDKQTDKQIRRINNSSIITDTK